MSDLDLKKFMANLGANPVELRHQDLTRISGESDFRSWCPFCKNGILFVMRKQQHPYSILTHDRCCACGRGVIYTDIKENLPVIEYK